MRALNCTKLIFRSVIHIHEQTVARCTDLPALLGEASNTKPVVRVLRPSGQQLPSMML